MTLSTREKRILLLGLGFLCILGIVYGFIVPFFESRASLIRGVRQKEKDLRELVALAREVGFLDGRWDSVRVRLESRPKGFTLFSFLESAADSTGLKDRIAYMKPSVTAGKGGVETALVEMKLEGVTLKQLVAYLHAVESPLSLVSLDRLSVGESRAASGLLDAVLQISTIRKT